MVPLLPARWMTRSVVSPGPVYFRVPEVMAMVPAAMVFGVPRLLAGSRGVPPLTLLNEETDKVPPLIEVVPQ